MDRYIIDEWVAYSNNDLEVVHQLLTFHPPKLEIICYHCQQSAEKILKAFCLYSDIEPPRTHNLKFLREKCEEIDKSFMELINECNRLNIYSVQPRYPF